MLLSSHTTIKALVLQSGPFQAQSWVHVGLKTIIRYWYFPVIRLDLKVIVLHTYNWYDDEDDGQLEVLHTHGSSKVPAGSFESDWLQEKLKQLINSLLQKDAASQEAKWRGFFQQLHPQ